VKVERRVGPERGDDHIPRLDKHSHRVAEQRIDPLAHHDVLEADAMMLSDSCLEVVILGIGVHPTFCSGLLHRRDRARRWTENALIRPDSRTELASARAFLSFRPDERHSRRQLCHKFGVARSAQMLRQFRLLAYSQNQSSPSSAKSLRDLRRKLSQLL